jgi:Na+/proline symporter
MNKVTEKKPWLTILITLISFIILGLGSLYFAVDNTFSLIIGLSSLPDNISFNKGAQYLWGVGFVLLIFVIGIIYTNYLKKSISKKRNKQLSIAVIFLLLFTFLFPWFVHYIPDSYLKNHNYRICEAKSKQWLHVKTLVYSKSASCN